MTFTFENIVSFFGLLLAGLAALGGVANWLVGRISASSAAVSTDLTEKVDDAMNRADRAYEKAEKTQIDIGTYKLEVAEKYATAASMKDVEERLVAAINNLTASMNAMPSRVAEVFNAGKTSQSHNRSRP